MRMRPLILGASAAVLLSLAAPAPAQTQQDNVCRDECKEAHRVCARLRTSRIASATRERAADLRNEGRICAEGCFEMFMCGSDLRECVVQ